MIAVSMNRLQVNLVRCARPFCSSNSELQSSSQQRLAKFIANSGMCSRRDAEDLIMQGRVLLNGVICKNVTSFVPTDDESLKSISVIVDDIRISKGSVYTKLPKLWAVYKSPGEIVAARDASKDRALLLGRIAPMLSSEAPESLKPIIRLDYTTEGLCLVSNSGALAKMLESEKCALQRTYRVRVNGLVTESKLAGLKRGLFIDGKKCKSIDPLIQKNGSSSITWLKISTLESSNRAIHKCFENLHLRISRMIAVGFGPFEVGELKEGQLLEVKLPPDLQKMFRQMYTTKSQTI